MRFRWGICDHKCVDPQTDDTVFSINFLTDVDFEEIYVADDGTIRVKAEPGYCQGDWLKIYPEALRAFGASSGGSDGCFSWDKRVGVFFMSWSYDSRIESGGGRPMVWMVFRENHPQPILLNSA